MTRGYVTIMGALIGSAVTVTGKDGPSLREGGNSVRPRSRVLFVDDDAGLTRAFARQMRTRGVVVDCCESGEQALALMQDYPYALVLCDLNLPGIDGFEVLARVASAHPDTQCLLVTGQPSTAWPAGVGTLPRVIPKPWNEAELLHEVTSALLAQGRACATAPLPSLSQPLLTRVLLLGEDPVDHAFVLHALQHAGPVRYNVRRCATLAEARAELEQRPADALLLDLSHPEELGMDCIDAMQEAAPGAAIIVVSGTDDEDVGLEAVKRGAQDYLLKGRTDPTLLRRTLRYAIERKRSSDQLAHLERHDPLTGLPNRGRLRQHLAETLSRVARSGGDVALLFVGLDDFKVVNDTQGHGVGDRCLVLIAQRLLDCVRDLDLVARLGGDQFAIVVEGPASAAAAVAVGERLRNAFATPYDLPGGRVTLKASIGVALAPCDGNSCEALLQHADAAMFRAKRSGSKVEFYDRAAHEGVRRRKRLKDHLAQAVEDGGFALHYQPQFDLKTGCIIGAEALLRFSPAPQQFVSPLEFIPLLEETDLILPVGRWVLDQVRGPLAAWQALTPNRKLRVSVNVSSHQLRDHTFVDYVREATAGGDGGWLELELTESVLLDNPNAPALLEEIVAMGVRLSIDDFGTGYSSLAYLARLPFHCLKIDRSFVGKMLDDARVAAIVAATIHLGHALGVDVVGEGIETMAQRDHLVSLDCDLAQGYLFARPEPAEEIIKRFGDARLRLSG